MEEYLKQVWQDLVGRVNGPFAFRLILQPMVAAIIAIRAALRDARAGRPAFGWAVVTDSVHRGELLREGWKDVARVFVAAVIVDLIYELIVFHMVYPGQSLIVAAILALLPYPLFRGLVNRILRRWHRGYGKTASTTRIGRFIATDPERENDSSR